jgi:hypothetical protein
MEPAQGSLLGRRAISHTVVTDHPACVFLPEWEGKGKRSPPIVAGSRTNCYVEIMTGSGPLPPAAALRRIAFLLERAQEPT